MTNDNRELNAADKSPESDPIGTIRREDHEGGPSIWVRMDHGFDPRPGEEWTCIWCPGFKGNRGFRLGDDQIARPEYPVIGAIPGTPAAELKAGA